MKPWPSSRSFNCHCLLILLMSRGLGAPVHPPVLVHSARKWRSLSCGFKRANYLKDKLSSAVNQLVAIGSPSRNYKENLTVEMFHGAVHTNWSQAKMVQGENRNSLLFLIVIG